MRISTTITTILICLLANLAVAQQSVHKLSIAHKNFKAPDGIICSNKTYPEHKTEKWVIEKRTLKGGSQEGVELVIFNSGKLSFAVIPTRGMSLLRAEYGDVKLGWNSPVKQVVHPKHINLNDHGGLGWLDGFNEMMCRCGVEFAGHPGEDDGKMLTLHGRIGNIPATNYEVAIDQKPPHRIRIRGLVEERRFKFGVFELWTEISTVPGSNSFTFSDRLINRSEYAKEYQIIYHSNFGRNLLEKDSKFVAPVKSVSPFDDYAAKDMNTFDTYLGPTKGFGEQVFCLEMYADDKKKTKVMLHNSAGDRGVSMSYGVESLPFFTLWKNTDTETDGYVTGLEPGTGFPYNRSVERPNGRVPKLEPGARITFDVKFTVLENKAAVDATRRQIKRIQGDRKTFVNESPPKKPDSKPENK